jgi:Skp family chaperone for outer membrane proteins
MAMGQAMPMGGQMHAPQPVRVNAAAAFEIDDEGLQAVQRGKSVKVIVLTALAALVGVGIGFGIGGMSERNKVAEAAVVGAKSLITEIDAANAAANNLEQVLEAAQKSLQDGKFPDEQVKALGGINVPFDGSNLSNKNIGRFKPTLVTQLITYTETASKVNTQKDKIRGLLSFSKTGVEELLAQRSNPTFRWGVSVQSGDQGPVAAMQVLPAAFAANDKNWPASFEFSGKEGKVSMKRYVGGDPTKGGGDEGLIIPVVPASQGSVCPTDTLVRLRRELADMQKALKGDTTPGEETDGIVQLGENIKKQLAAIGGSAAPAEASGGG